MTIRELIIKLEIEMESTFDWIQNEENKTKQLVFISRHTAISDILIDIKKLDGNTVKLCEGLMGQLLHEQYRDEFKHNYCPKCGFNLSPE